MPSIEATDTDTVSIANSCPTRRYVEFNQLLALLSDRNTAAGSLLHSAGESYELRKFILVANLRYT